MDDLKRERRMDCGENHNYFLLLYFIYILLQKWKSSSIFHENLYTKCLCFLLSHLETRAKESINDANLMVDKNHNGVMKVILNDGRSNSLLAIYIPSFWTVIRRLEDWNERMDMKAFLIGPESAANFWRTGRSQKKFWWRLEEVLTCKLISRFF